MPKVEMQADDLNFEFNDPKTTEILSKIGNALAIIHKKIPQLNIPKVFNVTGRVEAKVTELPAVKIKNFEDIAKYFDGLQIRLDQLAKAISLVSSQKIEFPKIDFPKYEAPNVSINQAEVISSIKALEASLGKAIGGINFPKSVDIGNFPRQMIPQPVTNINVNGLQGVAKTTSATVGTTLTQLPSYGQLDSRRSLIVYNNSSNTIYIGGSDVTTSNGLPIPANSFSPGIDAGYNLVVYGIASQAGNNVRVMEVSKEIASGTIQE